MANGKVGSEPEAEPSHFTETTQRLQTLGERLLRES
jgi:hypothetical protein